MLLMATPASRSVMVDVWRLMAPKANTSITIPMEPAIAIREVAPKPKYVTCNPVTTAIDTPSAAPLDAPMT